MLVHDAETGEPIVIISPGDSTTFRELESLKAAQMEHLQQLVEQEKKCEEGRMRQWAREATSESAKRHLTRKFAKLRNQAQEKIQRIKQDHEHALVANAIAAKIIR